MEMKIIVFILFAILTKIVKSEIWKIENEIAICPKECFCQTAHFMDLSVSRWVTLMKTFTYKNTMKVNHDEDLIRTNEASYENEDSYLTNPLMKQATCIFQKTTNYKELIEKLPHDIQSLVILYSEISGNLTVPTSALQPLNQLTTLEIRGSPDRSFKLLIDEPLDFLINANFESIKLEGSEFLKRPKNPVHPSESFDYVPNSEKLATYNVSLEIIEEELEILPYEVYIIEMKKSRMPTFYNWKSLEILRIHLCKLDELQWEMFDGLSELQHLSLERNDIKIIPAFALYGALHIKTLSLAHNNILDLHYRSLAGLLDLEILDLSYNNLTKLSELTFPPFPKLEYIDFRYNPIHYIFPATFGVMNTTQIILLGSEDTSLEIIDNKSLESLNLLKLLLINNASIETINQNIFKNLQHIETIEIHGYIGNIDFDAFSGLEYLKELNLSNSQIQTISMDAFIGCINLEIIDLSYNKLKYIQPGLFDYQTKLIEIYLQNNQLKFLPMNFFSITSLKVVRLTGNNWSCSCEMAFWDKKITNQYRSKTTQRCIKEFHSGRIISCRKINKYDFDNKLSPRCRNLKNRSLYYVLRHDLQCKMEKHIKKRIKQVKHPNQNETIKRYRKKEKQQKQNQSDKEIFEKKGKNNKLRKNNKREKSFNKKGNNPQQNYVNSLKYLSSKNNIEYETFGALGQIDDIDSFNII